MFYSYPTEHPTTGALPLDAKLVIFLDERLPHKQRHVEKIKWGGLGKGAIGLVGSPYIHREFVGHPTIVFKPD